MGLSIKKTTSFGIDAEYWCVWRFSDLNFKDKICDIQMFGFTSKAVRDEGAKPIIIQSYRWEGDSFDFSRDSDIEQQVYDKIKQVPEWESAGDVFE